MSDVDASQTPSAAPPRRVSPVWVGVVFVALLGIGFVISQVVTYTGPKIAWLADLDEAQRQADARKQRVFLVLSEAGDPVAAANDRELFALRDTRERLAKMVCCRLIVKSGDVVARRFDFESAPLMIVLDAQGNVLARLDGRVDEKRFSTYVHDRL